MKTLLATLFLCAGISAQVYDGELIDSLLSGMYTIDNVQCYPDSLVFSPHPDYVSIADLIGALQKALSYTEQDIELNLLYTPPAQKLRDMADKMEQKENDLAYLWGLLEKAKRYYGKNP